jgi:SAM-dependent methyltransferase
VEQRQNNQPSHCLLCDNKSFTFQFEVKDHFLTGETFSLYKCDSCGLISTSPAPAVDEIGRYYQSANYISHSSKAGTPFELLYQTVRNFTTKSKAKLVQRLAKGKNILDIGCATGEFLIACKQKGFKVFGVEPNEKAREIALENHNLVINDLAFLDEAASNSFDIITMWHVLEHVHDINKRMEQVFRLLRDDGTAIIALPNYESHDAVYYKESWAAYDVPRHLFHFNKSSFETLAQNNGFQVREILPMEFDSYYVSLLSEKYLNGKGSLVKAIFRGFLSNLKARRNNNQHSSLIYIISKS